MKAYLAGRYGRREELIEFERQLEKLGIEPGSRWLHHEPDINDSQEEHRNTWSRNDFEDVTNATIFIAHSEDLPLDGEVPSGWARGGRHVEFGIALTLGKPIFVVGPQENIFHWYQAQESLPQIRHFESDHELLEWLAKREEDVT